MYPYSTRSGRAGINYIRNSVKAVLDAYDGSVTFYASGHDALFVGDALATDAVQRQEQEHA